MALKRPLGPALVTSLAAHALMIAALLLALRHGAQRGSPVAVPGPAPTVQLVFLNQPGPGGGGGGGGSHMTAPPRRAELPGHDPNTVPARKSPAATPPKAADDPPPIPHVVIPVTTLASATDALPGSIAAPEGPPTPSQGPGSGSGAGSGAGSGDGPGTGPGFGPGRGGGFGGDVYQPGNGVSMPVEIRKGLPRYTGEAMRARIQGSVLVTCVVQTSGTCTDIRVVRSLAPAFGLDDEAVKAAEQWRFRPGMRQGAPVPVRVTMEIEFTLR